MVLRILFCGGIILWLASIFLHFSPGRISKLHFLSLFIILSPLFFFSFLSLSPSYSNLFILLLLYHTFCLFSLQFPFHFPFLFSSYFFLIVTHAMLTPFCSSFLVPDLSNNFLLIVFLPRGFFYFYYHYYFLDWNWRSVFRGTRWSNEEITIIYLFNEICSTKTRIQLSGSLKE